MSTRLQRSPQDRRLYALDGVGSLHREGPWWSPTTVLETADGRRLEAVRRGWRRRPEFSGPGAPLWESTGWLHFAGTLTVPGGVAARLEPTGRVRSVWTLRGADGQPLATLRAGRYLEVEVAPGGDPLLVLAAVCLVRWHVEDAADSGGAAGGGGCASGGGGCG